MRKYLESFFADFEYEKEDAEFLLNAYDSIAADSDTKIFFPFNIASEYPN